MNTPVFFTPPQGDVHNIELLHQLDLIILKLRRALYKLDLLFYDISNILASTENPVPWSATWDDPDQTKSVLTNYDPDSVICEGAKVVIQDWYPTFWDWDGVNNGSSIWHRLQVFWLYMNYIRAAVRDGAIENLACLPL